MPRSKTPDPKDEALRQRSCRHPHPKRVRDQLFEASDFFDPRDLVQVKYEMVRRVHVDGQPVRRAAATFGFSRPTFYHAQAALQQGGLAALVPKKPGPRRAHKLSPEVLDFVRRQSQEDPSLRPVDLVPQIEQRFGVSVHPRSLQRALKRQEKKRP